MGVLAVIIKTSSLFTVCYHYLRSFSGGLNPPPSAVTWVRSLVQEDPQKEMATHSSILAWEIPWTEERGGLQSTGLHSQAQLLN